MQGDARDFKHEVSRAAADLVSHLGEVVLGQTRVIEDVVMTVMCQGHALLTGAPGVAKTTLVRNLALSLGLGFRRIQFTPDLTPFDILGGETLQFDGVGAERRLVFSPGPVFTPFLLADEINRASPRTQSALLEAMQERQVTLSGSTYALPNPFFVFATQNPIETEGTFPLPEAQLDRFLVNIDVDYPDEITECQVAMLPTFREDLAPLSAAAGGLVRSLEVVESQPIPDQVLQGIVRIVRNTRPSSSALGIVKKYVDYGASPRAAQALVRASRAYSILHGSDAVEMEHVMTVAPSVLGHRCIANFRAATDRVSVREVIAEILRETLL